MDGGGGVSRWASVIILLRFLVFFGLYVVPHLPFRIISCQSGEVTTRLYRWRDCDNSISFINDGILKRAGILKVRLVLGKSVCVKRRNEHEQG